MPNEEAALSPEFDDEARPYRLDEVLTVVSGVNLIDTTNDPDPNAFTRRIGDLTGFMTGELKVEMFQLPRLSVEITQSILTAHPELSEFLWDLPAEPSDDATEAEWKVFEAADKAWYEKTMELLKDRADEEVMLSPIPAEAHTHVDAADEFEKMGGTALRTHDDLLDMASHESVDFRKQDSPSAAGDQQRNLSQEAAYGDASEIRDLANSGSVQPGTRYQTLASQAQSYEDRKSADDQAA